MATALDSLAGGVRSVSDLPGPRGLPLLGNALAVNPKKLHLVLERWAARYGPAYAFRIFGRRIVVISDHTAIAAALRDRPTTFRRMAAIAEISGEVGVDGVFSAEGATWRRQRQLVARALDAQHVRAFFPILRTITRRLKQRWDKAAGAGAPIDPLSELSRYTVDVTTAFAFEHDMNTLERDDDLIQRHLMRMFPNLNRRLNVPFPYWRYFKLPVDRAMERSVAFLKREVAHMVDASRRRLACAADERVGSRSLMEALLAQEQDGGARLSSDELFANIMTTLIAGEDTTAATLAWTLHFVAQHPAVQARLRAEAEHVLGADDIVRDLDDIGHLAYHTAVISESMRLKPVVPLFFLEANVATQLAGVAIPAGTVVFLAARASIPHAAAADAAEFVPERWLDANYSGNTSGDFAFGAGPRLCPGRGLAMLEMNVALSTIVRNFSILPNPGGASVREEFSFVMLPRHIRIVLRKRSPQTA